MTLPTPPIDAATGDLITHAFAALVSLDTRIAALDPAPAAALARATDCLEAAHSVHADGIPISTHSMATSLAVGGRDLAATTARVLATARAAGHAARAAANRTDHASNTLTQIHQGLLHTTYAVHAGRRRTHASTTSTTSPDQIADRVHAAADYATSTWGNPIATAAIVLADLTITEPYATGTARAARALLTYLFTAWNITSTIATPISNNLPDTTTAIEHYRTGNPHPIIALTATAILDSCTRANDLLADLQAETAAVTTALTDLGTRADSHAWTVAHHLAGSPITTSTAAGAAAGTDRHSGWNAASKIADTGMLTQHATNNTWEAPRILDLWTRHFPTGTITARTA